MAAQQRATAFSGSEGVVVWTTVGVELIFEGY